MAEHIDIPLAFKLGDKRYKVIEVESMKSPGGRSLMGQVCYDKRTITVALQNASTKRKYPKGEVANSFLHELTHAILHDMGSKLEADEGFVTNFADRLQEALETFKY
jgi:prolyl-tRNA synthetase